MSDDSNTPGGADAAMPRFWSVDTRRLTFRELWWMSGNPFTFSMASLLKIFRIPLDISQLVGYPPRILPLEPSQVEGEAYRRIYDLLHVLAQEQFGFCFLYREPLLSSNSRSFGAAALSEDGRTLAMVADAETRTPGIRQQQTHVALISSLTDGSYLITTTAPKKLLADSSIDAEHHPKADIPELIGLHEERLAAVPRETLSPLDRSWVKAVLTDLSERSFRFHSARGVYRPAKSKEVEAMRANAVGTTGKVPAKISIKGNLLAWVVVFAISFFTWNWVMKQPWNPLSSSSIEEGVDAAHQQDELYTTGSRVTFSCQQAPQAKEVADSAVLAGLASDAAVTGHIMPGFRVLARFDSGSAAYRAVGELREALALVQSDAAEAVAVVFEDDTSPLPAASSTESDAQWLEAPLPSAEGGLLQLRSGVLDGMPSPDEAIVTLGELVFVRSYATESRRARPWVEALQNLGARRVLLEHSYLDRSVAVSFESSLPPDESLGDLRDYFEIPSYFDARPPWWDLGDEEPISPETRRARRTFRELISVATLAALEEGDSGWSFFKIFFSDDIDESMDNFQAKRLELQREAIQRRLEDDDGTLDPEVARLYPQWIAEVADSADTESGFWEGGATARNLAQRLRPLQAAPAAAYTPNSTSRLTDPAASTLATNGFVGLNETTLYLNTLLFADTTAGLPALLAHLCETTGSETVDYVLEDDEDI